ncbi:ATP-binding protein [Streptomyces angustmyceticus]|uniref:ATP-binding protein n=1 Tax=Streptomyces angustmyceticus TaxID=285578 RepID=UPI0021AE59FC|nr:ATP-binding protein [Streptomyces angustmyceticus]
MRCHSQSFLLLRDPTSVPISRHRLQDLVKKWGLRLDESSDTALTVITSELVTNAVRHGTGTMLTITVSADLRRRRILVEVYDGSLVLPVPHWANSEDESGRGMTLVDRLSLCHGAEHTTCGKCVWAEIAMPPQRVTRQRLILRPRRAAQAIARRLGLGTVRQPRTAVRVDSHGSHGRHARAVPRRLSAPRPGHEQRSQARDQEEADR